MPCDSLMGILTNIKKKIRKMGEREEQAQMKKVL